MPASCYLKSTSFTGAFSTTAIKDLVKVTEVESHDWGIGRVLDAATGTLATKCIGYLLSVSFRSSIASGQLGKLMTNGTRIPSMELLVFDGNVEFPIQRLTFFDVGVEGLSVGSIVAGSSPPTETWSFSYRRVRATYIQLMPDGRTGPTITTEVAIPNF